RTATPALPDWFADVQQTIDRVDRHLGRTRARRERWALSGLPAVIDGLASESDLGVALKRYGDPANLPAWLPGRRLRNAALRVGTVLDDVRLLHSGEIEWVVLTFMLWARALLLVLAPKVGGLSLARPPHPDDNALWAVAVAWAFATAVAAPRLATLIMAESRSGLRTRRGLLAVELPLAVALALTSPGWATVAFAAGWSNWWQRLGRSEAMPDFSWIRLGLWILVMVAAQSVGLVLASSDLSFWQGSLEVSTALGVSAVIGGSYGAMLPVSAGLAVRVLFSGSRHRRLANTEAQRLIDTVADTMTRAANELANLPDRTPSDASAEQTLRRAVDGMLPAAPEHWIDRRARPLGDVVTGALTEGGHDMWIEDPRAIAAHDRARSASKALPVMVSYPAFANDRLTAIVLDDTTAHTLHRLLVACIVEARVHGTRRVQTIVSGERRRIEIRIANQPNPGGSRTGRGRGSREIHSLASKLPGPGELFRGLTDRGFVGGRGAGTLFGVRFTFTVSDTASRESRAMRTRLRRRPPSGDL
ncbi:MAG TPA: hypothetical protein VHZ75_08495, partial [Solirubrobacteraceae bacterium]|nr:hypothetical protein [Solirubrobacteraceae bacterium]